MVYETKNRPYAQRRSYVYTATGLSVIGLDSARMGYLMDDADSTANTLFARDIDQYITATDDSGSIPIHTLEENPLTQSLMYVGQQIAVTYVLVGIISDTNFFRITERRDDALNIIRNYNRTLHTQRKTSIVSIGSSGEGTFG